MLYINISAANKLSEASGIKKPPQPEVVAAFFVVKILNKDGCEVIFHLNGELLFLYKVSDSDF
jgi:hypothetical protein